MPKWKAESFGGVWCVLRDGVMVLRCPPAMKDAERVAKAVAEGMNKIQDGGAPAH